MKEARDGRTNTTWSHLNSSSVTIMGPSFAAKEILARRAAVIISRREHA